MNSKALTNHHILKNCILNLLTTQNYLSSNLPLAITLHRQDRATPALGIKLGGTSPSPLNYKASRDDVRNQVETFSSSLKSINSTHLPWLRCASPRWLNLDPALCSAALMASIKMALVTSKFRVCNYESKHWLSTCCIIHEQKTEDKVFIRDAWNMEITFLV